MSTALHCAGRTHSLNGEVREDLLDPNSMQLEKFFCSAVTLGSSFGEVVLGTLQVKTEGRWQGSRGRGEERLQVVLAAQVIVKTFSTEQLQPCRSLLSQVCP